MPLANVCVQADQSIRDASVTLNQMARGIVLVTDEACVLLGTITDGDPRGAMLEYLPLETPQKPHPGAQAGALRSSDYLAAWTMGNMTQLVELWIVTCRKSM